MTIQMLLGLSDFYTNTDTIPARFVFLLLPPIVVIIVLFLSPPGRKLIDGLNIKQLALLHFIRMQVELVLYFLFTAKAIPQIMTFEGRNFDIISGITAPVVYYFYFIKNAIPTKMVILWNLVCMGLLLNIVTISFLSAKTPMQQFGFEQPNIAISYFPFNWVPSVIVPLVLFSHYSNAKTANK